MVRLPAKKTKKEKPTRKVGVKKVAATMPHAKDRPKIHNTVSVELCSGDKALTQAKAKELLGWEEEEKGGTSYGREFLLKSNGVKVRCYNNITNRPLYMANVQALKQEILRGRWRLNGEPIIIGDTGLMLNGQHQCIALVEAVNDWEQDKSKWEETCPNIPTLDKVLTIGISEDDYVVNTMDTCKPRSLADVLYRSPFFADVHSSKRAKLAKMLDGAIKLLWDRTGARCNAYAPVKTHSEGLAFVESHPKLLECVKHVFEENGDDNKYSKIISVGYAAGLMYLMGSCMSSPEDYKAQRNESCLNWDRYDDACDFFVFIANDTPEVKAIREVLVEMQSQNENVSTKERYTLLIKAWNLLVASKKITPAAIRLEYDIDDDGIRKLVEDPITGGIDFDGFVDIPPEEIEERAEEARTLKTKKVDEKKPVKKTAKKKVAKKKVAKKRAKKSTDIIIGDKVVVQDDEPWHGTVVEILGKNAKVKIGQGYAGSGNIEATTLANIARV